MEIVRTYNHKTHGAIGATTLVTPEGAWTLDGKELPESSVRHLATFALQSLQDAYAGAKNESEAIAFFEAKRDKLYAGTLGTRGGGEGADERTRVARSIVRGAIKAKFGKDSPEWAKLIGLSDADQLATLDRNYESNRADFDPAIDADMTRRANEAKAKAALAKGAKFNI